MADEETFELADSEGPRFKPALPIFDEEPLSSRHLARSFEPHPGIRPWTRRAESGRTILMMTVAVLGTLILAWIFADWKTLHIAGWVCIIGAVVTMLLSYPLVVGLERPLRMSPERAVRDYFEALEHHGPLLRRMWLFLAPEGRETRYYSNFDGFQAYWRRRIREWQHRGDAWRVTPVAIMVGQVDSPQDAQNPNIRHLHFTVQVSIRGKRAAGPVATYHVQWTAVRGPDRQWYLLSGDLPESYHMNFNGPGFPTGASK
jgi:hypothetical protein